MSEIWNVDQGGNVGRREVRIWRKTKFLSSFVKVIRKIEVLFLYKYFSLFFSIARD